MSLFPAYSNTESVEPTSTEIGTSLVSKDTSTVGTSGLRPLDWLTNSSFIPLPTSKVIDSSTSDCEVEHRKHSKKRKKKPKIKKRKKSQSSSSDSDLIVIDRAPNESISKAENQKQPSKKKKKKRKPGKNKKRNEDRYFSKSNKIDCDSQEEKDNTQIQKLEMEEFLRLTETYNIKLREDPKDTATWLEYIQLQDRGEGTVKGIAEKKLSIIEKALSSNPSCEKLLNEKFVVMEKTLTTDKIASEAKSLVSKDSNNVVGWQWLIRCNQFTLSRMTVPKVLETYSSALQGFHKLSRNTQKMLEMILHCGLFLRQAGLWEHLWAFLEHYLELNLADPGSNAFKIDVNLPEDQIREIEDTIITCGLPLGAIWLRIEHLRETVHFLPVDSSEDPQRIIFPEDVSSLVFPVKKVVTPRLIAVALTLLKVPPLPTTDSFNNFIGLKETPWAYESTEYILAAIQHSGIVTMDMEYITIGKELVVGPQYLNEKLGETEFYNFVDKVFENCAKNADVDEKEPIFVWQLRWWRFVAKLRGKDSKELRSKVKKLLKQKRDCVPLYTEYALLEFECGDWETALRVLETAISLADPPLTMAKGKSQVAHLYRTYVETLLTKDFHANREKALKALTALAFSKPLSGVSLSDKTLDEAGERLRHLTIEVTSEVRPEDPATLGSLLVPAFPVSWLACHVWFLYLTQTVWESAAIVEKTIGGIQPAEATSGTMGHCLLESYYEILVNVLHHFCVNNAGHYTVLEEALERARNLFPDNLHFLNVSASTKMDISKSINSNINNTSLASIFQLFVFRDKMMKKETQEAGTAKSSGLHKKMYNILRKMSTSPETESCPIVWRLILQFLALESQDEIRKVFFQAAEKCPWVKSVYYGASQVLPEDLGQIQDLLVEKELRLHITPEEIEILREDSK